MLADKIAIYRSEIGNIPSNMDLHKLPFFLWGVTSVPNGRETKTLQRITTTKRYGRCMTIKGTCPDKIEALLMNKKIILTRIMFHFLHSSSYFEYFWMYFRVNFNQSLYNQKNTILFCASLL
jgi:hypothetical protein